MKLCFTLTMPGVGSWNGRWSGERRLYAKIVDVGRSKVAVERAEALVERGPFSHAWDDGWRASVAVRVVDAAEARRIRKASAGFCDYDWMIDNILAHGATWDPSEVDR